MTRKEQKRKKVSAVILSLSLSCCSHHHKCMVTVILHPVSSSLRCSLMVTDITCVSSMWGQGTLELSVHQLRQPFSRELKNNGCGNQ